MTYPDLYRQCPVGSETYLVLAEETLLAIAIKFNTTVEAITSVNPGINPLNIYAGLQICVPRSQPQAPKCPIGTSPYEIKNADTLGNIASRFGTSVQAIIAANPDINPNILSIGQKICITDKTPDTTTCPTLNTYVVRPGDTFWSIAGAFEITLQQLINSNPGINPNNIYNGLILCLPTTPPSHSIVVSIQPKILDLYREGRFVKSYPVAIGKPSTPTPLGSFTIVNKQVNPGGPFGTRWMGLSKPHYGIHGTNNPASIGTAASNGCIRMYNHDVEDLFSIVGVGTPVRIF